MLTRHPAGHLYVVTCDSCATTAVVCGDSSIEVAQTATHAGWTIGIADRCRNCRAPATTGRTRR